MADVPLLVAGTKNEGILRKRTDSEARRREHHGDTTTIFSSENQILKLYHDLTTTLPAAGSRSVTRAGE